MGNHLKRRGSKRQAALSSLVAVFLVHILPETDELKDTGYLIVYTRKRLSNNLLRFKKRLMPAHYMQIKKGIKDQISKDTGEMGQTSGNPGTMCNMHSP